MSTWSDNLACLPIARQVQTFCYPPSRAGEFAAPQVPSSFSDGPSANGESIRQQELAVAVAAAREMGMREAQAQANAEAGRAIEQERTVLTTAITEFTEQRKEYFRRVEVEAVRLALSIARKVLHREARMDPLLLSGVVRVALDQMQAGTRITLRTSPDSAPGWKRFCATQPDEGKSIEVQADESLHEHHCVLETELGRTEVSLDAQLAEIENGFFDYLRQTITDAP